MLRWMTALSGLFLTVFAAVALSGPGRIDITDGKVRYEVAHSIVDHGDVDIRDPKIEFTVLPGRGGRRYSQYRFPQSAAGVAAILAADATGPASEARRRFFFMLTSAVASAVLAATYAALFRRLGFGPKASLLWAAGGIFCTPNWYYGTSSFDEILGTAAVVLAVALALGCRQRHPRMSAVAAGLALGLAFNCKQPLGIFVLPVMAALYDPGTGWRSQWGRLATAAALLAAGVAVYESYEWYKFPPGSTAGHAELLKNYIPTWSGDPVIALVAFLISPAAGVLFYNPPLLLCVRGMRSWHRSQRLFCLCSRRPWRYSSFSSAPSPSSRATSAWGPRYLTPVFAVLWIMAPAGFRLMRRWVAVALLAAGLLVQVGALGIDPRRLYMERGLPWSFYVSAPELYFHPAISHLLNRPREIAEVLSAGDKNSIYYLPPYRPTFPSYIFLDASGNLYSGVRDSDVIDSLRPWWASLRRLEARARPVDIGRTAALLLLVSAAGLILMILGARGHPTLVSVDWSGAGTPANSGG